MADVVVVADDLTGANATGALLSAQGILARVWLQPACPPGSGASVRGAVIVQTASRNLPPEESARRVRVAVRALLPLSPSLFSKRVDSTLRGNLGAETDAYLEALGDKNRIAVIAACCPGAGRATVGGELLVNGKPLTESAAGNDYLNPVVSGNVQKRFLSQSHHKSTLIGIRQVELGPSGIAEAVLRGQYEGNRLFVFDCACQEHIERIAAGVLQSGLPFLCVDPGDLSAEMARQMCLGTKRMESEPMAVTAGGAALAVVGTRNPVTRRQIQRLIESGHPILRLPLSAGQLLKRPERRPGAIQAAAALAGEKDCSVLLVNDALLRASPGSPELGNHADADVVAGLFAQTAHAILERRRDIRNLFTCGGDISLAVCNVLGVEAIQVVEQVRPLITCGVLSGGPFQGIRIISKGGMAGEENEIIRCIQYLETVNCM